MLRCRYRVTKALLPPPLVFSPLLPWTNYDLLMGHNSILRILYLPDQLTNRSNHWCMSCANRSRTRSKCSLRFPLQSTSSKKVKRPSLCRISMQRRHLLPLPLHRPRRPQILWPRRSNQRMVSHHSPLAMRIRYHHGSDNRQYRHSINSFFCLFAKSTRRKNNGG